MPDVKELASSHGPAPESTEPVIRKSESSRGTERRLLKRSNSVAERVAMFQRRSSDVESSLTGGERSCSRDGVAGRQSEDSRTQRRSQEVTYRRVPGSPSVREMARALSRRGRSEESYTLSRATPRVFRSGPDKLQEDEGGIVRGMASFSVKEGFSSPRTPLREEDVMGHERLEGHAITGRTTRDALAGRLNLPMMVEGEHEVALQLDNQQTVVGSSTDGDTSVDSTPRRTDEELGSRTSSFASPFNSTDCGSVRDPGSRSVGGNGLKNADGGTPNHGVNAVHAQDARTSVPFGASALCKSLPNNGRGRPRGLRPRARSLSSTSSSSNRVSLPKVMPNRPSSLGHRDDPSQFRSLVSDGTEGADHTAFAVAQQVAPGVPMAVVIRAAVKIESVVRVLIARGYVRRKLVSEVTAFSLIMERGIEVIKHPFSGKGKPKNVTVNFVSRKGAMQLSWGGKGAVPLETIYSVTKGIKTDVLSRVVAPERADNCFSLLTPERSLDFEVDNPWLVLLVVRAMRLFLGAHYDTLPAPTFFSHLCARPRGSGESASPKQTLVWTGDDKAPTKEMASTPTERTSGDSESDSDGVMGTSSHGTRSPWEAMDATSSVVDEESRCAKGHQFGADIERTNSNLTEQVTPPTPFLTAETAPDAGEASSPCTYPLQECLESSIGGDAEEEGEAEGAPEAEAEAEVEVGRRNDGFFDDGYPERKPGEGNASPGGILSLFSNSGRLTAEDILNASSSSRDRAGEGFGARPVTGGRFRSGTRTSAAGTDADGEADDDERPTASQVLATRGGRTKRLNMAKRMSKPRETGAALKGKRFDLMAFPAEGGRPERKERGLSGELETIPSRKQGMSISIGAGYSLPEEEERVDGDPNSSERMAVVDDLNAKLQALRKLCTPPHYMGPYRPSRTPKTMAVKHMAFFQGAGGAGTASGMGSIADMWGDGVRKQYQTDMVRQKNQSVEDVRRRDDQRTAMVVTRSGVHRVTRKGGPPEPR